jgi:iron complex transport system substrate-binding protein
LGVPPVACRGIDMSSNRASPSVKRIWTIMAVVLTAVIAFSSGYLVGAFVQDKAVGFSIVDDYGRTVTLDGIPERIVSVSPTPTEILYSVGAGSLIVGADNYSDYPAEANDLPRVGDAFELNTEVIIALKPDLIVCGDLVPAQLDGFSADQGIPYVVLADRTVEGVLKTIRLAGIITGHVEEADQLAANLSARVDAVTAKTLANDVSKPKVLVETWSWGSLVSTFGPGSYGDDVIALAGGTNIARYTASEYPSLEWEYVIAQNPDIVVYTMSSTTNDTIAARNGWENVTAVKENHIYPIDDDLVSRYGARLIDGLEELAAIIHPELFP